MAEGVSGDKVTSISELVDDEVAAAITTPVIQLHVDWVGLLAWASAAPECFCSDSAEQGLPSPRASMMFLGELGTGWAASNVWVPRKNLSLFLGRAGPGLE